MHLLALDCIVVILLNIIQYGLCQTETCDLGQIGAKGQCQPFRDCPWAIEQVRRGQSPLNCGFEGLHPIVCCPMGASLTRPAVGVITNRKCNETYASLDTGVAPRPIFIIPQRQRRRISLPPIEENIGIVEIAAVGGKNSPASEYPHMAALGYGESAEQASWSCGGTLISERYVLTAAHCINPTIGPVRYVRVGDLDLASTTDDARPQNFTIQRTIIHPDYHPPAAYNDIALIELSAPAVFDNYVRPACLQTTMQIPSEAYSAIGWGVTSFGGTRADHLQVVTLNPFTNQQCSSAYEVDARRLPRGIDANGQICAGEATQDTCQGDSGGPLQIRTPQFTRGYTVIGLTSFGRPCGLSATPSVYTRVSHYIGWIESIVWPNE